jgi:NAD(P)-dependent dehydrogenase (short-subunit alcohol dehydrogenase family)
VRTIAIFGAGPALGLAVARRFGREGFRAALVARDPHRLDDMVNQAAAQGVQAAGFPADLTDPAAAQDTAAAIEARFGPIDVLEYSPTSDDTARRRPSELDPATLAPLLDKFALTPLALVNQVLPAMLQRRDGALLFALGGAAKYPVPHLAGGGMALAGLRNYIHTLHAELAPHNVYAGALLIGALIENSQAHRNASAWGGGQQLPVVPPDDLADTYWDMYLKRDRIEAEIGPANSRT